MATLKGDKRYQHHEAKTRQATVIIVGAGPVGLLTALRLGKNGINTIVLEAHTELLPLYRAMVYMPVVLPALDSLGILEKLKEQGFLNWEGVSWRDRDGKELAHLILESDTPGEFGGVLLIGQAKMNAIILEELKSYPSVEVIFGMRAVGIDDNPSNNFVKLMCHTKSQVDADVFFESKYILGTDGANSTIRRMSCIPFEGMTYQEFTMIGCDVLYDFVKEQGFKPVNFIVHPEDWAVIAYTGDDIRGKPQFRIAYVEPPDLPADKASCIERASKRIPRYMEGKTGFEVTRAEPYLLHQRCAAQARKGRVMLAGDALHSNNPIGGLGLTGGILDAFVFGNAFVRVINGGEEDQLLTECGASRRDAWLNVTNKLSKTNLHRLKDVDSDGIKAREEFFWKLRNEPGFASKMREGFNQMLPKTYEKLEREDSGIRMEAKFRGANLKEEPQLVQK
jgi:4-nitrocatechol/4-nitrophenol 4-monooxygenase